MIAGSVITIITMYITYKMGYVHFEVHFSRKCLVLLAPPPTLKDAPPPMGPWFEFAYVHEMFCFARINVLYVVLSSRVVRVYGVRAPTT